MLDKDELSAVTAPIALATTLPPFAYTSSEVFDVELKNIFYKEWICVARQDQIPAPGDYLTVDVADQPLIIVRLASGKIHAMSSICPHRAMPVVSDKGKTNQFQCPYHLWKFDLEGKLLSAPYMEGVSDFPQAQCQLAPIKLEIWQGFIFVNLNAEAQPLGLRLDALNAIVDGYQMEELVVASTIEFDSPWNWKILIENFMEAYHHIGPHKDSVQPQYKAMDSYSSGSITDGWAVLHMPETKEHDQTPDDELIPNIKGLSEKQRKEILASLIMPSFAWINTPSVAFWYQVLPLANNRFRLLIHSLLPREIAHGANGKEIAEAVQASIKHIHLEDIAVNAGPWKGMQAPLTKPGRLSLLEESIWRMNQWWVKRMSN